MRKYNKGKNTRFTYYETVEVDAEVDINLEELSEQIRDDEEARATLLRLLGVSKPHDERPIDSMLSRLIERSFELSQEDEELIKKLADKYNYLP